MNYDKGYEIGNEAEYLQFKANRMQYTMVKYRDSGMHTYTYFWKNQLDKMVSPFYDSEADAWEWIKTVNEWDNWKASKDIV